MQSVTGWVKSKEKNLCLFIIHGKEKVLAKIRMIITWKKRWSPGHNSVFRYFGWILNNQLLWSHTFLSNTADWVHGTHTKCLPWQQTEAKLSIQANALLNHSGHAWRRISRTSMQGKGCYKTKSDLSCLTSEWHLDLNGPHSSGILFSLGRTTLCTKLIHFSVLGAISHWTHHYDIQNEL